MIDAHQGNIPFSKEELGFKGALVVRSAGLYPLLEEYLKLEKVKWPQQNKKRTLIDSLRHSWHQIKRRKERPYYWKSLEVSDLILLPNSDELAYADEHLGLGNKSVFFPHGLSRKRQQAFAEAIAPALIRQSRHTVAFIGYWCLRKGAGDWAEIIQRTRSQVPEVKFLFLGTGLSSEQILEDLNLQASEGLEIVPSYESDRLPGLLSEVTLGAFPSYMEGFGLGVLEKLASGLPIVAYDIPGPREMLRPVDKTLMVPVGDVEGFSNRLIQLLKLEESQYTQLSRSCIQVAQTFDWHEIAKKHIEAYGKTLISTQKHKKKNINQSQTDYE
ncbi:glycosyltransferase [Roseofilum sp. BLCC_M91]|uniref:Glycosyltransferase n=1 Tax=Roseofilum halophilum BLCC-M91 TaxID=3022259 RepID=A0ABT7BJW8_9CYAN|nr:glycosyltransferase [Roseofilum halophilum]MDJ1179454.1 glycosyltransferase [Roseofilum halophilum BLCC-M91]